MIDATERYRNGRKSVGNILNRRSKLRLPVMAVESTYTAKPISLKVHSGHGKIMDKESPSKIINATLT